MLVEYTALVASALEEGHPAATRFAAQRFARLRALLVEQIESRQEAGRIRPDLDADQIAALIIAASDGLQTQALLNPDVNQVGALALLEDLLR